MLHNKYKDIIVTNSKKDKLNKNDIKAIAFFKDIVLNYLKINKLLEEDKNKK